MKLSAAVRDFLSTYCKPEIGERLFMGFTAGIPYLLRLTILDLWLKDAGLSNTAIALITLVYWPFSLRFLWAPFVEQTTIPWFSKKFGRYKGWVIATQLGLFFGLIGMALSSPTDHIVRLIFFAIFVTICDGLQDLLLSTSAFKSNKHTTELGPIAGVFVFGYRLGMFLVKIVSLYLAYYISWNSVYAIMAVIILLCTIMFATRVPEYKDALPSVTSEAKTKQFRLINAIKKSISKGMITPLKTFLKRDNSVLYLMVILFYRASDRMIQKMSKLFYVDIGFSKIEIANVVQVFGTVSTMLGGVIGGYLTKRYGIKKTMFYSGIVHSASYICYIILSNVGYNTAWLSVTVFVENITGGAIATSFLAFLYSLCSNCNHATTLYALLWSVYNFGGTFFRTVSGALADTLGWQQFFIILPVLCIPSLSILHYLLKSEAEDSDMRLSCSTT